MATQRTSEIGRSLILPRPGSFRRLEDLDRYLEQLHEVLDRLARAVYDLERRVKALEP